MTQITKLTSGIVKDTDTYAAVDLTDQQQSVIGTTKKYTISQLRNFIQLQIQSSNIRSTRVASTLNLSSTYFNGNSGIGATLTAHGLYSPLVIDSVTMDIGDRVLVVQQSNPVQNGVYVVTAVGSIVSPWVLTRASDYNGSLPNQIIQGDFVGVYSGSQNTLKFWCMISPNPINIGTSAIYFEQQEFRQTWDVVTSNSQMMIPNQGYIIQSSTLCTLVLPTSANVGDEIRILGDNSAHFMITQNAGQSIHQLEISSTIGTAGYVFELNSGSSIDLVCTQANTKFRVNSPPNGNFQFI